MILIWRDNPVMVDFSGSIEEVEDGKQWGKLFDPEMKDFQINHHLLLRLNQPDFFGFYVVEKGWGGFFSLLPEFSMPCWSS